MEDRVKNQKNPFAQGDPKEIARLIVSLIRETSKDTRSEEEIRQFEKERERNRIDYEKARYGDLPEHTYRILEQGSFVGWYYELEVSGNTDELSRENENKFMLFGNNNDVIEVARIKIAQLIGDCAAEKANFRFIFGGQL